MIVINSMVHRNRILRFRLKCMLRVYQVLTTILEETRKIVLPDMALTPNFYKRLELRLSEDSKLLRIELYMIEH